MLLRLPLTFEKITMSVNSNGNSNGNNGHINGGDSINRSKKTL